MGEVNNNLERKMEKTIDKKTKEENDKINKKIFDIGEIVLKSIRNGLVAFGGIYLVNEGFIQSENIEYVKNNFYTSEIIGGVIALASAYYFTLKNFFPKIYNNSVDRDNRNTKKLFN